MKRQNHLFEAIVDYHNLRLAWMKSIKGKRKSASVLLFSRDVSGNLQQVRNRFLSGAPGWGHYRSFVITDPKTRVITAAPFDERIMQHAIMNVLEPLFERHSIFHSYACRKGKGTHAAVLYAFNQCKGRRYFLKMDV